MSTRFVCNYRKDDCSNWAHVCILPIVGFETQKPKWSGRYTTVFIGWLLWTFEMSFTH